MKTGETSCLECEDGLIWTLAYQSTMPTMPSADNPAFQCPTLSTHNATCFMCPPSWQPCIG